MRLSNDFLQRLKDSVNINDIIGSYVDLKKKGRYYFASCPFHGPEKTPSFSVSPEKGFYYCFGCHESGDVFHFLQKMEGITFMEAVERVADYAHIDMPTEEISPEERQKAAMMKKMVEVTELAGSYFYNCLTRTQMGQAGMAYFEKRHLSMETIERFKLGFAPADWHRLYHDFTTKKQIDPKILTACGLCGYKNGNYFDMFRNRCMFPILDLKGRVVAEDVRMDITRASGNGGQGVNTTDSAVRLTHLPTGIVIYSQTERSQLQNKNKAWALLRSKLYDLEVQNRHDKEADLRRSQIGTGDRSEKIRTYNFPQSRVTDHRIKLTVYNLNDVMNGDLDEILDALIAADQAAKLLKMNQEESA